MPNWTPEQLKDWRERVERSRKVLATGNTEYPSGGNSEAKNEMTMQPTARRRQMNNTETRLLQRLESIKELWGVQTTIRYEAITLKLGCDLRYVPDFSAICNGVLTFWECKGAFIRPSGLIKIKAAAAAYPEFRFFLCQWKDGKWTEKRIEAT